MESICTEGQQPSQSIALENGLGLTTDLVDRELGDGAKRYYAAIMRSSDWFETLERLKLKAKGEVICPMEHCTVEPKRKRSKPVQIMQPVFMGYVMIEFVDKEAWHAVLADDGILEVLRAGEFLLTVAEKDLGGFRKVQVLAEAGWDGVTVEFVGGSFDGHRGVMRDGHVVLNLLGSEMAIPANGQTLIKRG